MPSQLTPFCVLLYSNTKQRQMTRHVNTYIIHLQTTTTASHWLTQWHDRLRRMLLRIARARFAAICIISTYIIIHIYVHIFHSHLHSLTQNFTVAFKPAFVFYLAMSGHAVHSYLNRKAEHSETAIENDHWQETFVVEPGSETFVVEDWKRLFAGFSIFLSIPLSVSLPLRMLHAQGSLTAQWLWLRSLTNHFRTIDHLHMTDCTHLPLKPVNLRHTYNANS